MRRMQGIWKDVVVEAMITNQQSLDKAVFDPAHRKSGSYWQWSSVALDAAWDRAAENVHKAWPTKMGNFEDQSTVCFGVLDESAENRWFYRVYPGGRDNFGRPGRYFFVLFRLQSPEQVLRPEVSGLLKYFEIERGLPLNTAPLDGDIPLAEPPELLLKLHDHWVHGKNGIHWGMDGNGTAIRFASSPSKAPPQSVTIVPPSHPMQLQAARSNLAIGLPVGLVIGLVVGSLLGAGLGYKFGYRNGNDRGFAVGVNSLPPVKIETPPVTTNTVQFETKELNERSNPERRMEERTSGKPPAPGSATNQHQGKPTVRP